MNDTRARTPVGNDMHEPPGANVIPDEDGRKLHGTYTSDCGVTQDRHVVCDETRHVRNRRHLTVGVMELPGMVSACGSKVQARQVAKIDGRFQPNPDQ